MSPRSWRDRVRDILNAITEINAFTQGIVFDAFQYDLKTIRAVELNLIIIGEAANHIPEDAQRARPEIPWHLMRAMRNRLVHAYFATDPQIIWDTIHQNLPPLGPLLEALVREPNL